MTSAHLSHPIISAAAPAAEAATWAGMACERVGVLLCVQMHPSVWKQGSPGLNEDTVDVQKNPHNINVHAGSYVL